MKLSVALAFGATILVTTVARAETAWVGNSFAVRAPSYCGNTIGKGDTSRVIYRPASTTLGNGTDSHLAILSQRAAFAARVTGGVVKTGVTYTPLWIGSQLNTDKDNTAWTSTISSWTMTPATLTATTDSAEVTFTIVKYYGKSGCDVTFHASLERAP